MVKNSTEVLKMLPFALGREQHFQGGGHSFLPYRPNLSMKIIAIFFPAINWLTSRFTKLYLSLNWPGLRAVYKPS